MYSNSWDSSSKPPPANNPFLESSAANRFPALDTPQTSFQSTGTSPYGSQPQSPSPQFLQSPYGVQQPQQQFGGWSTQPQQLQSQPSYNQGGYSGYSSPIQTQPTGFGGFGQQYGGQNVYGGQFQSPAQPQFTGYPGQFQQQQQPMSPAVQQYQQNVITEFDPFSGSSGASNTGAVGGAWNNSQQQGSGNIGQYKTGPRGQQHPRVFIQSHKAELESWNAVVWRQAITAFEDLKTAWENRRADLNRNLLAGQYLTAQDTANLQMMIKDAESKIDSSAAALFQMQEVNAGYKLSLDTQSKNRVREGLNAGLRDLPDWP